MPDDRLRIFIEAFDKASLSMDGIAKKLGVMAAGYLSLQAAMQAVHVAIDALQAAEADAVAASRLEATIRGAGLASTETAAQIHDLTKELALTTNFTDEAIASAQALLISLGHLTGDGLKRATQASADLAALMGGDITEAARMVATATDGTSRAFQLLGVRITDTMTPGEKFEALLRAIEDNMHRLAQEQANVSPWHQWSKAVEEANEALGRAIGNARIGFLSINDDLKIATAALSKFNDAADASKGGRLVNVEPFTQAAALAKGGQALVDFLRTVHTEEVSVTADRPTAEQMSGWAKEAAEKVKAYRLEAEKLAATMADLDFPAQTREFFDFFADTGNALPGFTGLSEEMQAFVAQFLPANQQLVDMGGAAQYVDQMIKAMNDDMNTMSDRLSAHAREWREIGTQIQRIAVQQVADFAGALVGAAIQGELNFGKMIRSFLAGLAAAIIQALVLKAIMNALNSAGPAGIVGSAAFGFARGLTGGSGGNIHLEAGGGNGAPISLAPSSGGSLSLSMNMLGTAPAFVRNVMDTMSEMARQEGYQFSAEVVGG